MAAWHDPDVRWTRRAAYAVMVLYLALPAFVVGICLWKLWTEVLAAWPQ